MALFPQPNVPGVSAGASSSTHSLSMAGRKAASYSAPEFCPPGVEVEPRASACQAACVPTLLMSRSLENGPPAGVPDDTSMPATFAQKAPPGVPIETSLRNATSYMSNPSALFNLMPPQCGNTAQLPLLPMPHGGRASNFAAWPYVAFAQCLVPPWMPPKLPSLPPPPPPPPPPMQRSHKTFSPPSKVPMLGSFQETVKINMARELSVPREQKLTVFVGQLPPSLDDAVVTSTLKLCGSIKSWTRAKDPSTGSQKGFGFVEYESPESLLRALRLLNRLKLEGKELVLKVDKSTLDYLENYVDKKIRSLKPQLDSEAECVPGLEVAHVAKSQTLDVPRELPVEERLGWVFKEENEIDKEVCENLVKLLEKRNRIEGCDLSLNASDIDVDIDDITQCSPTAEDRQRVQLIEWKKFEYDLEKCKLKGQGIHGGLRSSDSYYLEYEKLWEERERAKAAQRKNERERGQAKRKMRKMLVKDQEESSLSLKRMCSDERHKKRLIEKEKDDNMGILEQQDCVLTAKANFRNIDSSHLRGEGEPSMQSKFRDLSNRAKVAFCFKSSLKTKQPGQTHTPTSEINGLQDTDGSFGEGENRQKQVMSSLDHGDTVDGHNWSGSRKATDAGYKQQKEALNKPAHSCSEERPTVTERCKSMTAKELIDKLPRTKDDIFAFCMNWETFDKNCLHERIRPWVSKKISEFLGEEEVTLVDFIVTSAKKHMAPMHLLELLVYIFVEEAELFVVKLWRVVIYEIWKVEHGLTRG